MHNAGLLKRLSKYLYFKKYLIIVLLFMLIITGFFNTFPIKLTEIFINKLSAINKNIYGDLIGLVAIYLAVRICYIVFDMANRYITSYLVNSITYNLRQELFEHLIRLSHKFHDNKKTGDLIVRSTSDIDSISSGLINPINWLGNRLIVFIWYIFFLGSMDWQLTLVYIIAGILIFFVTKKTSKISVVVHTNTLQKQSTMWTLFYEALSGVKEIQSFLLENNESRSFKNRNNEVKKFAVKEAMLSNIINASASIFFYISIAITWLIGGYKLYNGSLMIGELVVFISYGSGLLGPLIDGSMQYEQIQKMLVSAKRLFEILDIKPDIENPINPVEIVDAKGKIKIQNMCFKYSKDDIEVLKNINVEIEPGEKVAIVGQTGSSKTTLIKLLCRFYDEHVISILSLGLCFSVIITGELAW